VINNRPDREAENQPESAALAAAAARVGLDYRHVPVVSGKITDDDVAAFARALDAVKGPVLAFCRTGTRSTTLGHSLEVRATQAVPSATTDAAIGNWNHTTDRNWHGYIDFIYLWNRVLDLGARQGIQRTVPVYEARLSGGTYVAYGITGASPRRQRQAYHRDRHHFLIVGHTVAKTSPTAGAPAVQSLMSRLVGLLAYRPADIWLGPGCHR
jgi:protein tyrosine phosphatase (PTP) superfamily phosphohydrolase (DUF442 family)